MADSCRSRSNCINLPSSREREDTERRIEREKQEAALLKKQQDESAARNRSVEELKRELERLEELKRMNAAKARLQVCDKNDFLSDQELQPQTSELPSAVVTQAAPVYQDTQF